MKVSTFKLASKPSKPYDLEVDYIVDSIKKGVKPEIIEKIRLEPKRAIRNDLKEKNLPVVCWSGLFSYRSDKTLVSHSGLMCIDFDHIPPTEFDGIRKSIEADEHTMVCFISPSGDGLKVVVKIPASVVTHKRSCNAYYDRMNLPYIDTLSDVARCCFMSCDYEIYYNPDSKLFEDLSEPKYSEVKKYSPKSDTDLLLFDRAKRFVEGKGIYFIQGNRHTFVMKLSATCNHFGVDKSYAIGRILLDYQPSEDFSQKEEEDTITDIYTRYEHQHGCAQLSEGKIVDTKSGKDITNEVLDDKDDMGDIITVTDVESQMDKNYHEGILLGETTYIPCLDEFFRWVKGELTIGYGIPSHGKTTFLLHLCLIKAVKEGKRWAIFTPEQYPPTRFFDKLVHAFLGKPLTIGSMGRATYDEYVYGREFIKKHFFYIYPKREAPTPKLIQKRFELAIKEYGADGCIIDPYNQLDHDIMTNAGGREDLYLSAFLGEHLRFGQINNIYNILITHPKKLTRMKANSDMYERPTFYELSGGAMWYNKTDNLFCVYRPNYKDSNDPIVEFHSDKIKNHDIGARTGMATLEYNRITGRYCDLGYTPLDENSKKRIQVQNIIPINPNKIIEPSVPDYEREDTPF